MKKLFLFVLLCSLNLFATDTLPELSEQECKTTCSSVSQSYTNDGGYIQCHDIMLCNIREWNIQDEQCEFIKTETRKFPITCTDILPAL